MHGEIKCDGSKIFLWYNTIPAYKYLYTYIIKNIILFKQNTILSLLLKKLLSLLLIQLNTL